ncbi:hypothetical protein BXZ70DRAFT_947290 [Cristinia sonorae]|uniref:non-specific serine/threonine protein kinase n=1 Tax=Cristinia sonorae TaxID=1940300 RepID=A0A8K0UKQ0_9AGAR|nr:hypothetical protein BXZ70DRAFT_947290 [Cristinia sonorae]
MSNAQAYPQQHPNKGTLIPGQTIAVNKYTVQVERYLSQGGFAHVYLVRTAQPVHGTTHHVLKRIAVPNESMLTEVKKEVDIMRILKGHPNIVHLIDAAWHRMANGVYEVFILMEFCQGGGIIDMMNRRLRERLTEPEILTIFVEVCEGLAAMHSLKPPLLHRDLKVENILQASSTSYKLCDFGSATAVQRIPSTTQELRALEADVNRHTTLQYRAPEMVDVHMRRPIDEKSDVWALGVLLYKLCYYTTPFEEHGPLAILNVQYKIPPYPGYSQNMNALIASMLREHGAHRPTVFEILNHVHALRGTKSRFTYSIPQTQPSIPPRPTQQQPPLQTLSPNILSLAPANPLDDLVQYKRRSQLSPSPARNAGTDARDKVLEAIAPMRRGRPTSNPGNVITPPASPKKESTSKPFMAPDPKFGAEGDRAWSGIRGHKSGMASFGGSSSQPKPSQDAWGFSGQQKESKPDGKVNGFDSDFSAFGKGFGDSFEPSRSPMPTSTSQPIPISRPAPSPSPSSSPSKRPASRTQTKDAFADLGIPNQPPPQTLGDARRTRTGMATMAATTSPDPTSHHSRAPTQYLNAPPSGSGTTGLGTSNTFYRPPSAHSPAPSTSSKQGDPWRPSSHHKGPSSSRPQGELTAEEKYPSLEDLDRKFASPSPAPSARGSFIGRVPSQPPSTERLSEKTSVSARPPSRTSAQSGVPHRPSVLGSTGTGATTTLSAGPSAGGNRFDGVRSQHVTGAAMRESRITPARQQTTDWTRGDYNDYVSQKDKESKAAPKSSSASSSRPLPRRHRSSISIKSPSQPTHPESLPSGPTSQPQSSSRSTDAPPKLPPRPLAIPASGEKQRDWLTGNSDDESQELTIPPQPQGEPILRESPSKRASFFERSPVLSTQQLEPESGVVGGEWPSVEEWENGGHEQKTQERQKERDRQREREKEKEQERRNEREREKELQREKDREARHRQHEKEKERRRQEQEQTQQRLTEREREQSQREKEKIPPQGNPSRFITRTAVGSNNTGASTRGLQLPALDTKRSTTPSPTGLTDNWSPVDRPFRKDSTSSSEGGPEDVAGFRPKEGRREPGKLKDQLVERDSNDPSRRRRTKSKGRQSSVHDLVDLWGGGLEKDEKEKSTTVTPKSPEKRRSVVVPATTIKPPSSQQTRSASPASIAPATTQPPSTSSRFISARPPSRTQGHRKETSTNLPPGARALPAPIPATSTIGVGSRARPQSMMVGAVSKPTSAESDVHASATAAVLPTSAQSSLSPPAEDARAKRSGRRSSISDMVQRYEAYNGGTRPGSSAAAPATVPKPAGLSVKVASTGNDGAGLSSPATTAAMRFPKLSPTTSPVMAKSSLAVPDDTKEQHAWGGRTSPITGLPGRASPSPSLARFDKSSTPALNGHAPRIEQQQSYTIQSQQSKPFASNPSAPTIERPIPRKAAMPSTQQQEDIARSPSPEKPFQGVSKLIDRWNRAVEETGDVQPKKVGAVGSLSGRR